MPGVNLLPFDGEALFFEGWLDRHEADGLLAELVSSLDWRQEKATFGARSVPLPRLTAWYGEVGYRYSGIYHPPCPFPAVLERLRRRLDGDPNSVLANFYRDGSDSMSWHSDDEPELGRCPRIWSVSLGATRRFLLRHRQNGQRVAVSLTHGSLLLMAGSCQERWRHSLPKTSRVVGPRINLTFRLTAAPERGPAGRPLA